MSNGRIDLVVALRAEAQPLIEHFNLSSVRSAGSFRRFANDDRGVALTISGVGRVAAAAAVSHYATGARAWLNFGVAGHDSLALGTPRMAHKIRCASSGRSWYPVLAFEVPCPTATVCSVDRAIGDFPDDDLYDMEAAGYFETAARFAPHELIHSLKVVSDNRAYPAETMTRASIEKLVGTAVDLVDALAASLQELAAELSRPDNELEALTHLLQKTHFTTTQRRQLRRLLRRWSVVCPDVDAGDWVASNGLAAAGSVIGAVAEYLEGIAPAFGSDA